MFSSNSNSNVTDRPQVVGRFINHCFNYQTIAQTVPLWVRTKLIEKTVGYPFLVPRCTASPPYPLQTRTARMPMQRGVTKSSLITIISFPVPTITTPHQGTETDENAATSYEQHTDRRRVLRSSYTRTQRHTNTHSERQKLVNSMITHPEKKRHELTNDPKWNRSLKFNSETWLRFNAVVRV